MAASQASVQDPAQARAMLATMADRLGREIHVYFSSRVAVAPSEESQAEPTRPIGMGLVKSLAYAPMLCQEGDRLLEDIWACYWQSFILQMGQIDRETKKEEEPDDFYDLTPSDYARLMANKKEDIFLKTRKIRDEEAAARRALITTAIMRVQFPDNYILEAQFQSSDKIMQLVELLKKVVSRSELPFYLYTTPPKERLNDLNQDFYSAGLTPGALVYFSYDLPKGTTEEELEIAEGPYLCNEVMDLQDLHLLSTPVCVATEQDTQVDTQKLPDVAPPEPSNPKPKKTGLKPKWMKL
eukprot:c22164_g2_i1 orf=160-1050(+)